MTAGEFNKRYKVGQKVYLREDSGEEMPTQLASEAWVLGSGYAVVRVNGKRGGWDIDRIRDRELER